MRIIQKKLNLKEIIFGCTGTIGEMFPEEKIKNKITELSKKISNIPKINIYG